MQAGEYFSLGCFGFSFRVGNGGHAGSVVQIQLFQEPWGRGLLQRTEPVSGAFLKSLGCHGESSEATDGEGVRRWFSMESLLLIIRHSPEHKGFY